MISTVIVAFSMFSAIPMPQTEWTNKSMRYALCAFPLIGAVIGALVCLWRFVCLRMEFSEWILAAGICVLPVLVTGGIHLDGFCDTADALASHQDTEKKLQILKDPHMGAFAAIWLGCYFIAQLALAVTAAQMQADLTALAFGYCISRSLSGLAVASFPLAKNSGLAYTFAEYADKKKVRTFLAVLAAVLCVLCCICCGKKGIGDGRCTPIETIHISQAGGFGRTLIDRADYRVPALGYVVRYGALMHSLQQAFDRACKRPRSRLHCLEQTTAHVAESTSNPDPASANERPFWRTIALQTTGATSPRHVRTRLIVHAEGTPPDDSAGVIARGYGQRALIFEAGLTQSHGQRAWERFTPQGPLALLPVDGVNGQRVSVVYTVPENEAEALLALDDAAILQRIQRAIGPQACFTDIGPRASFPLKLRLRQPVLADRELWIGNAAQTLHPVSGQGFNLGLRDAAELAQALRQTLDPGSTPVLSRYARRRQLDRWGAAAFTDGIVRTFSTPFPALNTARGLALSALDLISPLRHFVARRMIWGARAWP